MSTFSLWNQRHNTITNEHLSLHFNTNTKLKRPQRKLNTLFHSKAELRLASLSMRFARRAERDVMRPTIPTVVELWHPRLDRRSLCYCFFCLLVNTLSLELLLPLYLNCVLITTPPPLSSATIRFGASPESFVKGTWRKRGGQESKVIIWWHF